LNTSFIQNIDYSSSEKQAVEKIANHPPPQKSIEKLPEKETNPNNKEYNSISILSSNDGNQPGSKSHLTENQSNVNVILSKMKDMSKDISKTTTNTVKDNTVQKEKKSDEIPTILKKEVTSMTDIEQENITMSVSEKRQRQSSRIRASGRSTQTCPRKRKRVRRGSAKRSHKTIQSRPHSKRRSPLVPVRMT